MAGTFRHLAVHKLNQACILMDVITYSAMRSQVPELADAVIRPVTRSHVDNIACLLRNGSGRERDIPPLGNELSSSAGHAYTGRVVSWQDARHTASMMLLDDENNKGWMKDCG